VVVGAYAFVVSYVLAKLIDRFMGFRVSAEDETTGIDFTQQRRPHTRTACTETSRRAVRRCSATWVRPAPDPRRPKKAEPF